MINVRLMQERDIAPIISWGGNTETFLKQWSNYSYPLTSEQIMERIKSDEITLLAIDDEQELIGTIQVFKFDKVLGTARVGCFLINPLCQGKGYGRKALQKVVEYGFNELDLKSVNLGVFDYNSGAIRCYEKVGFKKVGEYEHPMGWLGHTMEIQKKEFMSNL